MLEDVARFVTHATWAETFVIRLAETKNKSPASAWFLELCYEYAFGGGRPANAIIVATITDTKAIQEHGEFLVRTPLRWTTPRTYWRDVFQKLGLNTNVS